MNRIGIIYKFTIIAKYKFDGHKPFYVGQHWERKSKDKFLSRNCSNYYGSGSIWTDFVNRLERDHPIHWRKFIKREVLYQRYCSQKILDTIEAYYIKKEQSHYSYKKGGCNVLWGTANEFGSGSPMKDPMVRKKVSKTLKKTFKDNPAIMDNIQRKRIWKLHHTNYKEKISKTLTGRYVGSLNPNYGNYWNEEQREKLSCKMKGKYVGENNPNYGNYWSEEKKKQMSEDVKKSGRTKGKNNPMFGKKRITNGIVNSIIEDGKELPEGFWYGMKSRRQ